MGVKEIVEVCISMIIFAVLGAVAVQQIATANLTGVDSTTSSIFKLTGILGVLACGVGFVYMVYNQVH